MAEQQGSIQQVQAAVAAHLLDEGGRPYDTNEIHTIQSLTGLTAQNHKRGLG